MNEKRRMIDGNNYRNRTAKARANMVNKQKKE